MTIIQFLNAFRTFSADVLLLALGVTLVTSLCKKTVFKRCSKKVFVVLPFVLGTVFYACYRALTLMSATPFTAELADTLEKGFSCGLAATLYYVVYEQFFRTGKLTVTVQDKIIPFFEGVIPDEKKKSAADEMVKRSKGVAHEELFQLVKETLDAYAYPELLETDKETAVLIVSKALAVLI